MAMYEHPGIRLGQAMYERNVSQRELAKKIGVNPAAVSYWCSGEVWMNTKYLVRVCKVLGVSADWLLFGEENGKN